MSIYKVSGYGLNYYGSTKRKLSIRKSEHKNNYNNYLKKKYSYVSIFEIIKLGDKYNIELVEEVKDVNKLCERENYYITNKICVNKKKSGTLSEKEKLRIKFFSRLRKYKELKKRINKIKEKMNNFKEKMNNFKIHFLDNQKVIKLDNKELYKL